jgi:hypothetical protein
VTSLANSEGGDAIATTNPGAVAPAWIIPRKLRLKEQRRRRREQLWEQASSLAKRHHIFTDLHILVPIAKHPSPKTNIV